MKKYICIHGHFYQPPRENPWTNEIEEQKTAQPFHNWNERITAECYAVNAQTEILQDNKEVKKISNNYASMSFNFGPTLLSWMQDKAKDTYDFIIKADQESRACFSGHGSAIAQSYNHMIMPLANKRDKRTQIRWGIYDFDFRFGRKPEGMWLPETAVDIETLECMAEYGIAFTILAPHQAKKVKRVMDSSWINVEAGNIDTKVPYWCNLPSGKKIALFFYNGKCAHDVAFGNLLKDGERWVKALLNEFPKEQKEPLLVHIATDGETYGHHQKFGNMALAYLLDKVNQDKNTKITNYGEFLSEFPPSHEVQIAENTSWSCRHGIERWRGDCGCALDPSSKQNQKWRAGLRLALDFLRDELSIIFEQKMYSFVKCPWLMRDEYIRLTLDSSQDNCDRYFAHFGLSQATTETKDQIKDLLEMQRFAMLMYTSCGWFFDDISRIETLQIIQYAAKTIEYAKKFSDKDIESPFLKILETAKSNDQAIKNGKNFYLSRILPKKDYQQTCNHG